MRAVILACCAMASMFLTGMAAGTAPPERPVRVGLMDGNLGRGMVELGDGRDGYAKAICEAAAAAVGMEVEFVPFPGGKDEVEEIERGTYDIVGPLSIVDLRLQKLSFTSPIVLATGAVFYRDSRYAATTAEQLRFLRVGVAVWGAGQQWCMENGVRAEARQALRDALRDVEEGRLDAVVTSELAGACEAERLGFTKLRHRPLAEPGFVRAFAFASVPTKENLIAKLNTGLEMIRASGEASTIYDRWISKYQPNPAPSTVPMTLAVWGAGALLFLGVVSGLGYAITRSELASRSKALRLSQEQYRLMTESLGGVAFCVLRLGSKDRRLVFNNSLYPQWQQTFPGLNLESDFSVEMVPGIRASDRERVEAVIRAAIEQCQSFGVEFRLADCLGQYHWIHFRSVPSSQPDGVLWQGLLLDVTEARELAESLRESEIKFKEIVENCQDGIVVVTIDDGVILEANPAAVALLGVSRERLVGTCVQDVMPGTRDVLRPKWSGSEELHHVRAQGPSASRQFEVRIKSIDRDERPVAILMMQDVTGRERVSSDSDRIATDRQNTLKDAILPLQTFTPAIQFEPKPIAVQRGVASAFRRVMVVDDEQLVRDTLRNMLRTLGIQLTEVDCGERAIEQIKSGAPPDCVLLDITMPGMDGVRTLSEMRRICPGLPVLLCSGYARLNLDAWVSKDPLVRFLPKPYTLSELAAALNEIAAKKAASSPGDRVPSIGEQPSA